MIRDAILEEVRTIRDPQYRFCQELMPHSVGAFFEERMAFELLTLLSRASPGPAKLPGFANICAGSDFTGASSLVIPTR